MTQANQQQPSEQDQKALIAELEITVSMFASAIKSGEPWSEECQARLDVLAHAKESL